MDKRDKFKRLPLVGIALFSVGVGITFLRLETQALAKAKDSQGWVPTDGVVLHTDYERTSAGRRTSNGLRVTYSYQVQGENYTSNVYSFGGGMTEKELLEQYPTDRLVTVFYDPMHPEEATLVKGVDARTIAGVRYAWVVLALALAFLAYVVIAEVIQGFGFCT